MRNRWIGLMALVLLISLAGGAGVATAEEKIHGKYRWVEVDADGNRHEETIEFDGPRPYLGVQMGRHSEAGAAIEVVIEDSAAAQAGLVSGDRIVAFNGDPIENPTQLTHAVLRSKVGERVDIEYVRDDRYRSATVELGEQNDWVGGFAFGDGHFEIDDERVRERVQRMVERVGDRRIHVRSSRPRLGVQLVDATAELRAHLGGRDDEGVLVGRVMDESAADLAGIEVGDLIVAVDGESVDGPSRLRNLLSERIGESFYVDLIRDGRTTGVRVTLDPEEE